MVMRNLNSTIRQLKSSFTAGLVVKKKVVRQTLVATFEDRYIATPQFYYSTDEYVYFFIVLHSAVGKNVSFDFKVHRNSCF